MRVEQEQKVTEDARISAEQDAAAQKYAVHVLQVSYYLWCPGYLRLEDTLGHYILHLEISKVQSNL